MNATNIWSFQTVWEWLIYHALKKQSVEGIVSAILRIHGSEGSDEEVNLFLLLHLMNLLTKVFPILANLDCAGFCHSCQEERQQPGSYWSLELEVNDKNHLEFMPLN